MNFKQQKASFLSKKDKSKKGSVDKDILQLVRYINSLDDYFTTSSCSGRIMIIRIPESEKKYDYESVFVSHREIKKSSVLNHLRDIPEEVLWFKQEPFILHVCSRTIDNGMRLLDIARSLGFKRSGIIAHKNRIIVEITSTEKIDLPLSANGKLMVDDEYVDFIVTESNKKIGKNLKNIEKLYKKIKENL